MHWASQIDVWAKDYLRVELSQLWHKNSGQYKGTAVQLCALCICVCGRAEVVVAAQTGNKLDPWKINKLWPNCCRRVGKINDGGARHRQYWNELFPLLLHKFFMWTSRKVWQVTLWMCNTLRISDCLLKMVICHRIQRRTLLSVTQPPQLMHNNTPLR